MDTNQLQTENQRLKEQLVAVQAELKQTQENLRRAKDASPVARPSQVRVKKLVEQADMDVCRLGKFWVLRLGHLTRSFRSLREIWELLVTGDWYLSDIFPQGQAQKPKVSVKPRLRFRQPVLAPAANFSTSYGGVAVAVAEDIPFY